MPKSPSDFQYYLLRIVRQLQPNAYGVTIYRRIRMETGRDVSFGTLQANLEALEADGLIESYTGPGGPERGRREIKYWRKTNTGSRIPIPAPKKSDWSFPELGIEPA